jgi:isopentenyl diphosphate isomerase/L-lactate dehydrogenase-like FMN-dependent dehydrogenase
LHENQDAYRRLRIHYRVLRDVSKGSMVCKIFDSELAMPILAAPTAFHRQSQFSCVFGSGAGLHGALDHLVAVGLALVMIVVLNCRGGSASGARCHRLAKLALIA